MKVYDVPLTLADHDSDIKMKACTPRSFVTRFCLEWAQISGKRLQDHWSSELFYHDYSLTS